MLKTARAKILLPIIIISLLAVNAFSQVTVYENPTKPLTITAFDILEDKDGRYEFADVSSPTYSTRYRSINTSALSLGINKSAYWVRFFLPESPSMPGWIMKFNDYHLDNLDLYLPIKTTTQANDWHYVRHQMGISQSANSMDSYLMYAFWGFPLPDNLAPGQPIYLRIESTSALMLSLTLWQPSAFYAYALRYFLKFGVFYGILVAMALYNLFICSILRDRAYLYYVLYVSTMLLYQLMTHGHLRLFVNSPYQLYHAIFWAVVALLFVFAILFTKQFLHSRAIIGIDHVLSAMLVIAGVFGMLGVLGYELEANYIAHALALIAPVIIIGIAVIRLRQGFRPARYFLLAWGVLAIGTIVWAAASFIAINFSVENCFLLTVASEAILLSLALADRIKGLQAVTETLGRRVTHFRDLSQTDELTGLYNKRHFNLKLAQAITTTQNSQTPLAFLVLDIDYFKEFNDRYGHWEGDQVLARIGRLLADSLRSSDSAFRYGGEEFAIILPNTTADEAVAIAEHIRQAFNAELFYPAVDVPVTLTISIGVTEYTAGDTAESLFKRADDALYQVKSAGRNRVICMLAN